MKVKYLKIDGYKNLNNMEIVFNEDSCVCALIGNNGSGKSNILEVITRIFGSVYAGTAEEEKFNYELEYEINEETVQLKLWDGQFSFLKEGKKVSKTRRMQALPKGLYLYYCGETKRLEKLSNWYVDEKFEKAVKKEGVYVTKYISYITLDDCASALLANAAYKSNTYEDVCEQLGIEGIGGPVTFCLKNPYWSKRSVITEESFWNAKGSTKDLLDKLKNYGEFVIEDNDHAKITISHISDIKDIWECESECDLFIKCKMLSQQGVLEEIQLCTIKDDKEINLNELSEGEKQLAELLCILDATKDYKALFLLDEFDSYLHPNWQRKFAELIADIDIRGQMLFTTHSPLTLGKMKRDNVIILKDGDVYMPSADTYNRDVSEVMTEVMDVNKRPIEVEGTITDFKKAVMEKNREDVQIKLEQLRTLLSEDDPFWGTAEHWLARLER